MFFTDSALITGMYKKSLSILIIPEFRLRLHGGNRKLYRFYLNYSRKIFTKATRYHPDQDKQADLLSIPYASVQEP
jgi:hypothetical protein